MKGANALFGIDDCQIYVLDEIEMRKRKEK